MSSADTRGVRVEVEPRYLPEESSPETGHYVFAYTVTIANFGKETAQLRSRHWVITDATGSIEEVRGPGVVGSQPTLAPGQAFRYTSGCVLRTPRGTMHGTFQMHLEDESCFDAEIAPFLLIAPGPGTERYLN